MVKKIYLVAYSSYLDELYTEVSVHTDYDEASSAFNTHIEDIKESVGVEDDDDDKFQCLSYANGRKELSYYDPFNNHEYSVSLEIHELKS